jgi:hypothetical protein
VPLSENNTMDACRIAFKNLHDKRAQTSTSVRLIFDPFTTAYDEVARCISVAHGYNFTVLVTHDDCVTFNDPERVLRVGQYWSRYWRFFASTGPIVIEICNTWSYYRIGALTFSMAYNTVMQVVRDSGYDGMILMQIPYTSEDVASMSIISSALHDVKIVFILEVVDDQVGITQDDLFDAFHDSHRPCILIITSPDDIIDRAHLHGWPIIFHQVPLV